MKEKDKTYITLADLCYMLQNLAWICKFYVKEVTKSVIDNELVSVQAAVNTNMARFLKQITTINDIVLKLI